VFVVLMAGAAQPAAAQGSLDGGLAPVEVDAGVMPPGATADAGVVEGVLDAGVKLAPRPVVQQPAPRPAVVAKPKPEKKPAPEKTPAPIDLGFLAPVRAGINAMYYDLSVVNQQFSPGFAEGGMRLTGVRFLERNSGLGKMLTYFVTQLLMAAGEGLAASQGRYVGSTYGLGYRVDYYRPYSSRELSNMRAAREQAGDALLESNMSLDLQLYLPVQGLSTASGISVELTPFTFNFTGDGAFGMEVAFQYTKLTDVMPGDPARLRSFESVGTPIRFMLNFPVVQVQLQWSPNFIGGFGVNPAVMEQKYAESAMGSGNLLYTNSPWSLGVTVSPLPWVFVRGTGLWTKYEFALSALGYQLEAGLRF
jgi:hypothetical protein